MHTSFRNLLSSFLILPNILYLVLTYIRQINSDMQDEDLLDNSNITPGKGYYWELILWWEKKRIYYNVIMILVLAFVLFEFLFRGGQMHWMTDLFWAFLYLFGANLFYTSGWIVGIPFVNLKRVGKPNTSGRWFLLILGTLFSIFWMADIYSFIFWFR